MCTSPFFKIVFLSHRIKIILNEENLQSSKAKEAKGGKSPVILWLKANHSEQFGFLFSLWVFFGAVLFFKTIVEKIPHSILYPRQKSHSHISNIWTIVWQETFKLFCLLLKISMCLSYWVVNLSDTQAQKALHLTRRKIPVCDFIFFNCLIPKVLSLNFCRK